MKLSFIRTTKDFIAIERDIVNTHPAFNRISKDKERLTDEDLEAEQLEAETAGAERYVMFEGERPVGILEFLMINPKDACTWLGLLVIRAECQGRGLGSGAMAWFDSRMRERGVGSHRLGVLTGNSPAHVFWQSQGAVQVMPAVLPDGKPILIYERAVRAQE